MNPAAPNPLAERATVADASSGTTSKPLLPLATELGLLPPEVAATVADEAARSGVAPEQLLLQQGRLQPVQWEILHTLARPADALPGYEVLGVLGYGGMGVVYRARQQNLDRIVALKTMLVSRVDASDIVARFEREARTVARLQHPHIIAAYDFGRHDGRLFFAMELVDGEDLERFIQRHGRLDDRTAWGIARQIAAGLAHAAEANIIHRDIKPANVLLIAPPAGFPLPAGLPMVKIADFGLAYLVREAESRSRLTSANIAVGSPHYMAPEQFSGETASVQSDMYSLGATIYHALAGQLPFRGVLSQIVAQKLRGAVDFGAESGLSPASSELIARLMRSDPRERPRDYGELLQRIDALQPAPSNALGSLPPPIQGDSLAATQAFESIAMTETRTHLRVPTRSPPVARRSVLAAGAAAAALAGVWGISRWRGIPPSPRDDLRPTGASGYLFRDSLDGWQPVFGSWSDAKDHEHAKVIAGQDGQIRRRLSAADVGSSGTLPYHRLTLQICPHNARSIELQFGLPAPSGLPRPVLRIADGQVFLARRHDERGAVVPFTQPLPRPLDRERYYAVSLERRRRGWFVMFEEQLVGAVPAGRVATLPEFRLAVEGGPAWFTDFELAELVPQPAVKPSR